MSDFTIEPGDFGSNTMALKYYTDNCVTIIKYLPTFYKVNPHASKPKYATSGSACFDLSACLIGNTVTVFNQDNTKTSFVCDEGETAGITIGPGQRALIPTGIILDIPGGYNIRIHPRSGTAIKYGLTLINAEGIIDTDYVEELMIPVINLSSVPVIVNHGDRIAQGEPVVRHVIMFEETSTRPSQKTTRNGGFGSTGVK